MIATDMVLIPVLCTALYYLIACALITAPLRRRYLRRWKTFISCPSCLGFWIGVILALGAHTAAQRPFFGIPGRHPIVPLLVGLYTLWWTPVLLYAQQYAIWAGRAIEDEGAGKVDGKTDQP